MKIEQKQVYMRTQKYNQVKAIVDKYETLASETDIVKEASEEIQYDTFIEMLVPKNPNQLNFIEQLMAHIYQLCVGKDSFISDRYKRDEKYYIKGLLTSEDEQFLIQNFDIFVDLYFKKRPPFLTVSLTVGGNACTPAGWSSLVPHVLNKKSGKIFIANSDRGCEFMDLGDCELTVDGNFADAEIRAFACGYKINEYNLPKSDILRWSDLSDKSFDTVLADVHHSDEEFTAENIFKELYRIIRDGGELLFGISKDALYSDESEYIRHFIKENRVLQEAIQLSSNSVLLHIVKQPHDTVAMVDATTIAHNDKTELSFEQLIKDIRLSANIEASDSTVWHRFPYNRLDVDMFMPSYYLSKPNGVSMNSIADIENNILYTTDDCNSDEKVSTVNYLSPVFSKGNFNINDLPVINLSRQRKYYRITGPAVVMAVSEKSVALGYTVDNGTFLVPKNLYVLKPKEGIDVKYLAAILLSDKVKKQILALAIHVNSYSSVRLMKNWENYVNVEVCPKEKQQYYIQETIQKDFSEQEKYAKIQEQGFKHSIRLRKHALSQNISAFDSMFKTLEHCMKEHNGSLNANDLLSSVSQLTVVDAMMYLHNNIDVISERVSRLCDDQDWGKCEIIEPQKFFEDYEQKNKRAGFRFENSWIEELPLRDGGTAYCTLVKNHFEEDVFDEETGKLVFHAGEPKHAAWFPSKALTQVVDNIVSNACSHGFTDKDRSNYKIRVGWNVDDFNMVIKISNNGSPIPSDFDMNLLLEYGYSSALNYNGHGGLGGGEIVEIMQKYGGNVKVISTPEKDFTVTYELTLPLASLY